MNKAVNTARLIHESTPFVLSGIISGLDFSETLNPQEKKVHLAMTVYKNSDKLSSMQQSLSPARCKVIMPDKSSKVEVQIAKKKQGLTPFVGLYAIKKLWNNLGLSEMIDKYIGARRNKGYSDSEQILAAVLLNLAGGDAPEHMGKLKDVLSLPEQDIAIPSITAMRSYAACYHLFSRIMTIYGRIDYAKFIWSMNLGDGQIGR